MCQIIRIVLEALLVFLIIAVCNTACTNKYVIVVLTSVLLLFVSRRKEWSGEVLVCVSMPVVVYLLAGGVSTLLSFNAQTTAIKIMLFWTVPLLFTFALYVYFGENMLRIVDMQFVASCMIYVIPHIRFGIENGFAESTFAFVFGAYLIYYVFKNKWIGSVVSAILMCCCGKRIAILAAGSALAVLFFMWIFRNHKKLAITIWGVVVGAVNIYIYLICSGILEYFCQGIGINTNGRNKIYAAMIDWIDSEVLFVGKGLGIVEELLGHWKVYEFNNLHNDLLKFYIEIGIIGLMLYLVSYGVTLWLIGKKFGNAEMSLVLSLTIYSIVLFATDNVSIYIIYLIPIYSIYFAVLAAKEKGNIGQVYDNEINTKI